MRCAQAEFHADAGSRCMALRNVDKRLTDMQPGDLAAAQSCQFNGKVTGPRCDFEHSSIGGQQRGDAAGMGPEVVHRFGGALCVPLRD